MSKLSTHAGKLSIISNQGAIGGGEVMLLAIARAVRDLGWAVTVVAPATPSDLADRAQKSGFETVRIPGNSAPIYLLGVRRWASKNRSGALWCNGLRPSLATAGMSERIVHLHQLPSRVQSAIASVARVRATATLVPSRFVADRVPGARALWNWVSDSRLPSGEHQRGERLGTPGTTVQLGYLGRLTEAKGVLDACSAVEQLLAEGHDVHLQLAGEATFVSDDEAKRVRDAIARLDDHATVRGWVDKADFFDSVDLALFPSVTPESFGLVVAEAMAAKCPFVISDAGALSEVAGKDYAFVSKHGDAASLAVTIGAALDDRHWSSRLNNSHERWKQNFTETAGRKRVANLLEALGWGDERA